MTAAALKPRKRPRQSRAAATVEAIVEAAARILEEAGADGFNTNAVAQRAGVSIGSLYQYFPGKEALVAELSARAARELLDALDRALRRPRSGDLADGLRALIGAGIAWQNKRPRLAWALDRFEAGLGVATDAAAMAPAIGARIAAILAPHAPHLRPAGLRRAAEDCLAIVRALFDAAEARGKVDTRQLKRSTLAAVLGYLDARGITPWRKVFPSRG